MALIMPCPNCKQPLQIPQPVPEKMRCPSCGSTIKRKESPASAAPPPKVTGNHRNVWIALAGILLVGMVLTSVLVLTSFSSNGGPKSDLPIVKNDPDLPETTEKNKQAKENKSTLLDPDEVKPKQKENKGIEAKVIPETPTLSPQVYSAIQKGVRHLQTRIAEYKTPPLLEGSASENKIGELALSGLALLESGVPPFDPSVQKVLAIVREKGPKLQWNYPQCTVLFFLNRLGEADALEEQDRQLLRSLALRLVAGQTPGGQWNYFNPILTPEEEQALDTRARSPGYTPQNFKPLHQPDHSTTQFALLALWGSRRQNVPVRNSLLYAAAGFHRLQDAKDGSWTYETQRGERNRDSNTCAGLLALAMEKALREDKKFKDLGGPQPIASADLHRDKAFAYLAKTVERSKRETDKKLGFPLDFADAMGSIYFLWCLERVAVIYDKKKIGTIDWYNWGSNILVKTQLDNGSWNDRHGEIADTCFSLLFLTRANLARDLTASLRSRGPS